jgi:hypothetical protein
LEEIVLKRISTLVLIVFAVLSCFSPTAGWAQDHYTYTVSVMGGLGGSMGDDDAGLGNQSLGLGLSLLREDRVHVGLRFAQIEFDAEDRIGDLSDASLNYVVAGGEYRFLESFYESGLFIGLGAYELEGTDFLGGRDSETGAGIALGVTGEFEINRRVGFLVEFLGHVTGLESNTAFATGQAGIAVHF